MVWHKVLVDGRTECRADALSRDQVFMGNWKPVQRSDDIARRYCFVRSYRALHRLVGYERDDGIHFRIDPFDLSQVRFHHLPYGKRLCADMMD